MKVPPSSLTARPSRLVIGYGNPLRADDGLGWLVGQRLDAELSADEALVLTVHQLAPELAEPIGQAGLVVFVDAREGGRPGQVHCQLVAPDSEGPLAFSHDVDPPALLELARLLYGACPTAIVVSVSGLDFGYGVGLSAPVQAALPAVLQQVRTVLVDGIHADGMQAVGLAALSGPAASVSIQHRERG